MVTDSLNYTGTRKQITSIHALWSGIVFTKHLVVGICSFYYMIDLVNVLLIQFEAVNDFPPLDMRVHTLISKIWRSFSKS